MDKADLIKVLRALGVKKVRADYDGSGDSGSVNCIYADDKDGKNVDLPNDRGLSEAIEEAASAYLEHYRIDWYNDHGGYGEWHLDVDTGQQKLEHNQRVPTEEYEEHEDDFLDEEDKKKVGLLSGAEADAEEMLVCTCPTLKDGHHHGCPYQTRGGIQWGEHRDIDGVRPIHDTRRPHKVQVLGLRREQPKPPPSPPVQKPRQIVMPKLDGNPHRDPVFEALRHGR